LKAKFQPPNTLVRILAKARVQMAERLLEYGIEELFILRIKPRLKGSRDDDWLACYRSFSQFGGKPIFWINARFIRIVKGITQGKGLWSNCNEVLETFFHEYGHVICEYSRGANGGASLRPLIQQLELNEEDFCEEFARFMNHRRCPGDVSGEAFERILQVFFVLAFEQEEVLAA
jgi:hypothetical protein